ncbi:MAG: hypothetical protein IPH84_13130 [Bacteroidales bacterium]|nr:hypothetical protein [Bacteroidales bacterium]
MLILSPGEKVNLISPTAKLGIDAKIDGSPQTEFLYRTINLLQPFDARRDSLNTQYNNIQKSTERDSLSPMVIAEFMKNDSLQKNLLLREFQKMPGTLAWMFLQDKFDMTTDFAFIDQMEKALYKSYFIFHLWSNTTNRLTWKEKRPLDLWPLTLNLLTRKVWKEAFHP